MTKETVTAPRPLEEIMDGHNQWWVWIDKDHEAVIVGRDETGNGFFCKSGIYDGLCNLGKCLAVPIIQPEMPNV